MVSDLAVCRLCKGEAHRLGGLVFHTEWLNGCPLRSSEGFTPDQWQALHGESVGHAKAKELCTHFYRWWHNQPGTNTDQGFDDWWEAEGAKRISGEGV